MSLRYDSLLTLLHLTAILVSSVQFTLCPPDHQMSLKRSREEDDLDSSSEDISVEGAAYEKRRKLATRATELASALEANLREFQEKRAALIARALEVWKDEQVTTFNVTTRYINGAANLAPGWVWGSARHRYFLDKWDAQKFAEGERALRDGYSDKDRLQRTEGVTQSMGAAGEFPFDRQSAGLRIIAPEMEQYFKKEASFGRALQDKL